MGNIVVGLSSGFPQTSTGRTREQLATDILDFTGGSDRPEAVVKAGRTIDSAVREYNNVAWKFNRLQDDITLTAKSGSTVTRDYTLNTDFKQAFSAVMVDSDGNTRYRVDWIPYEQWARRFPDQSSTGSVPFFYTIRNKHQTGIVTVDPGPGENLTWPTLRINYNRRIALGQASSSVLNVPEEVEEGITQLAISNLLARTGETPQWERQRIIAFQLRIDLEAEHRDWPDRELF